MRWLHTHTGTSTKGVDSTAASTEALEAAKQLARANNCVVGVSGATDFVTDGTTTLAVDNGVALLTKVTATGCSVTALVAAFVAAGGTTPLVATAAALAVFGWAAERAMAAGATGPGSLRVGLLDQLYALTQEVATPEGQAALKAGLKLKVVD